MIARIAFRASGLIILFSWFMTASAQLTANFTASPTSGCAPLIVHFSDQSTGSPTQWRWDLGNGTTSFLQNPSVTYFNPGLYSIKLVIRNAAGADSLTRTEYIRIFPRPQVDFSTSDSTGCYPLPVQFNDLSTSASGSIASWQWDFGDGYGSTAQNPHHVYSAAGNYNVTLQVRNSHGCVQTLSRPAFVRINSGVRADFSNTSPNTCTAPVAIQFTNTSTGTGTINYQWDFGDGSTSTEASPTHQYQAAGSYNVTLIAVNSHGCRDTLLRENAISLGNVQASFQAPATACAGAPVIFQSTSAPTPGSVHWTFGDGSSNSGLTRTKVFQTAGTYTVKMVADFGACSDSSERTIIIHPKPAIAFTTTDTANCRAPHTVTFSNTSTLSTSYQWLLGDGSTSTTAEPTHTYQTFGNYHVSLIGTNTFGCVDTLRRPNYIRVQAPVISLRNLPDSGCMPFTKSFSNTLVSSEPASTYLWNFGDGTTSNEATPTHTYTAAGIYPITLIITTPGGCTDTATIARGVIVNAPPQAAFTATPREACARVQINFTDSSLGTVTNWLWDFGDGSTSTAQNPSHQYTDTGYFNIQLIVWNSGCPDTLRIDSFIRILPPVARFNEVMDCAKPYERTFTDRSIGADEYYWNFGDGTTSNLPSPTHTFPAPGIYTVSLRVVNLQTGCDHVKEIQVQIIDVAALFQASDTVVCKGTPVQFTTGISVADVNQFTWNFGNGTAVQNVSQNQITHTYTQPGLYSVQLVIRDILGCRDTLQKPNYIRVYGPTARFRSSVPGSCLNATIQFIDSSSSDGINPITRWTFQYGDGITETLSNPPFEHTYSNAGAYTVRLRVTDSYGCSDSTALPTALIISRPVAQFTTVDTVTCPNRPVRFINGSSGPNLSSFWQFGDGNTSTSVNATHQYNADGLYAVSLRVVDRFGCRDSITKPAFVRIVTPVAQFTMSDTLVNCPPALIAFTNTSTAAISQIWDFGDNTTATTANPSHFYTEAGTYRIRLTVTARGGCTSTFEKTLVVLGPRGSFSYNPLTGCNPVTITLNAQAQNYQHIVWDYNDGSTFITPNTQVSHTYTFSGVYVPRMILVNAAGCQVPIVGDDTIVVNGVTAKFGLNQNRFCDTARVVFRDSSSSNEPIVSYLWQFGDGNTSTLANPTHDYTQTGIYQPQLIVTTEFGCRDTVRSPLPIYVVRSPRIEVFSSTNGCVPLNMAFSGFQAQPDTSQLSWQWNFGNGNTFGGAIPPAQIYTQAGSYNIQVAVTNSSGCVGRASRTIEAFPIPLVSAGTDTLVCRGRGITLRATGAQSYSWSPSTGLSCTTCATPVANPSQQSTYVLRGTSQHGCIAFDTIQVRVQDPFRMTFSRPDTLCKGERITLQANGAASYEWSPTRWLNNPTSNRPIAQPDSTIRYRVVGRDAVGCFQDTGYVNIRVFPIPTVDAGPDKTINVGQTIDLVPTISSDVTEVTWSPTTGLFRNIYPGITVKPNEFTEYTVEAKNPGGCTAQDKVAVFVVCNGSNVFMPNTFSPNNDGANDLYYPRGSGLFRVKSLRIFNRWGEVVYQKYGFNANDPASAWDGRYKGVRLTPDVFVWTMEVLCDNNTVLILKGNVAIIL